MLFQYFEHCMITCVLTLPVCNLIVSALYPVMILLILSVCVELSGVIFHYSVALESQSETLTCMFRQLFVHVWEKIHGSSIQFYLYSSLTQTLNTQVNTVALDQAYK